MKTILLFLVLLAACNTAPEGERKIRKKTEQLSRHVKEYCACVQHTPLRCPGMFNALEKEWAALQNEILKTYGECEKAEDKIGQCTKIMRMAYDCNDAENHAVDSAGAPS
jgi:ABC-type protease/lipase transport system fused ATPase/permease subunit